MCFGFCTLINGNRLIWTALRFYQRRVDSGRPEPRARDLFASPIRHRRRSTHSSGGSVRGIFEGQVGGWYRVPSSWPVSRDFDLIKRWFEYRFHSMLVDLGEDRWSAMNSDIGMRSKYRYSGPKSYFRTLRGTDAEHTGNKGLDCHCKLRQSEIGHSSGEKGCPKKRG